MALSLATRRALLRKRLRDKLKAMEVPKTRAKRTGKLDTPERIERYELVKNYVKQLGKRCSEELDMKVTFRLYRANHNTGRYEYDEAEEGDAKGRVTIAVRNGQPQIISSFVFQHVVRHALRNLNQSERIKMTKSENTWKGAHS